MTEALPSFAPFNEKNLYLWPSEKVWVDATTFTNATLYILFCPESKGRDQFTIELGWSKLRRFPELIQRPSLAFKADFENCYERQEVITRLPYLTEENEWIDINGDDVEEIILKQMKNLIDCGMPFLLGIKPLQVK